jgi:hypothetical protein
MQTTRLFTRLAASFAAIAFAAALAAASGFAASGFVGKWKTTDTEGKTFMIWLSDDGNAKGDRSGEGLSGMWKEEGDAAVITWDSGWVTKITKEGDTYKKTALENGKPVGEASEATKEE